MKLPKTTLRLPFISAVILICLLAVQACEKRSSDKGTLFSQHDPQAPGEFYSRVHVPVPISIDGYKKLLDDTALHYQTDYCEKLDTGICCECFTKIGGILAQVETKKATAQEPCTTVTCLDWTPDAMHVSQWISFANAQAMEDFFKGMK